MLKTMPVSAFTPRFIGAFFYRGTLLSVGGVIFGFR